MRDIPLNGNSNLHSKIPKTLLRKSAQKAEREVDTRINEEYYEDKEEQFAMDRELWAEHSYADPLPLSLAQLGLDTGTDEEYCEDKEEQFAMDRELWAEHSYADPLPLSLVQLRLDTGTVDYRRNDQEQCERNREFSAIRSYADPLTLPFPGSDRQPLAKGAHVGSSTSLPRASLT
jgi:hypothetical protein